MKPLGPVLCALLLSAAAASAQDNTRIILGSNFALPGETMRIPVELETGGKRVAQIEGEIRFPIFLSFVALEPGTATFANPPELKAELLSDQAEITHHKLRAVIRAPEAQWLPDGIVAVLSFKVAPELQAQAKPGEEKDVEGAVEGSLTLTGRDGEKIPAQTVSAIASVMLAAPSLPACFFYMH